MEGPIWGSDYFHIHIHRLVEFRSTKSGHGWGGEGRAASREGHVHFSPIARHIFQHKNTSIRSRKKFVEMYIRPCTLISMHFQSVPGIPKNSNREGQNAALQFASGSSRMSSRTFFSLSCSTQQPHRSFAKPKKMHGAPHESYHNHSIFAQGAGRDLRTPDLSLSFGLS